MRAVIGFNHLFIGPEPLTGPGYYAVQILETMLRLPDEGAARWDLRAVIRAGTEHHYSSVVLERAITVPRLPRKLLRVAWEQMFLPRLARKHGFDVLFSPGFVSPLTGAPVLAATIHDMYYMIMPRTVPPFQRAYWKVFLPLSSRVCDVILTVSSNSGKDIETFLPAAAGKVVVTPLASRFTPAEPDTVLATLPTTQQYVLMIANLTPNKNVGKVVEALAILRGRGRKVDLVHIGSDHLGELASASARHAAGEWVRSLGKVSDEELIERARGCLALVVPSLYEGFGMPAMEALALGAPLICSNRGALPEVAGEAALIVDPVDAPQIADAITALIDDPTLRPRLQQAGLERAAQFSWVRTAEQTLEAFARHLPPARFAPAEFGRSAAD